MVNRLATPLPDSVLDRYYAEHPDEVDHRKVAAKTGAHVVKVKADTGGTGIVKSFDTREEAETYAAKFPDQSRVEIVDAAKPKQATLDPDDFADVFES